MVVCSPLSSTRCLSQSLLATTPPSCSLRESKSLRKSGTASLRDSETSTSSLMMSLSQTCISVQSSRRPLKRSRSPSSRPREPSISSSRPSKTSARQSSRLRVRPKLPSSLEKPWPPHPLSLTCEESRRHERLPPLCPGVATESSSRLTLYS